MKNENVNLKAWHAIKYVQLDRSLGALRRQAQKVLEEAGEVVDVLDPANVRFETSGWLSKATRSHLLEECIDVYTALFAIFALYDDSDINEMIDHVNNKNRLRGYVE